MSFIGQWQPLNSIPPTDVPIVFLAGPIQCAPDWQSEAVEEFGRLGGEVRDLDFCAANPRTTDPWHGDYDGQVLWELAHLSRANDSGVIMFWLAKPDPKAVHPEGRAYAQTSRFELGEWVGRNIEKNLPHPPFGPGNLVVGIEPGFSNERYIRKRLSCLWPGMHIPSDLETTVSQAVIHLRGLRVARRPR